MKQLGPWSWRPAEDGRPRIITWVGGRHVSTVSMDFGVTFIPPLPATRWRNLLGYSYETMVFPEQVMQRRYDTQDEALLGHRRTVEILVGLFSGARLGECGRCGWAYAVEDGSPTGNLCDDCWYDAGHVPVP